MDDPVTYFGNWVIPLSLFLLEYASNSFASNPDLGSSLYLPVNWLWIDTIGYEWLIPIQPGVAHIAVVVFDWQTNSHLEQLWFICYIHPFINPLTSSCTNLQIQYWEKYIFLKNRSHSKLVLHSWHWDFSEVWTHALIPKCVTVVFYICVPFLMQSPLVEQNKEQF